MRGRRECHGAAATEGVFSGFYAHLECEGGAPLAIALLNSSSPREEKKTQRVGKVRKGGELRQTTLTDRTKGRGTKRKKYLMGSVKR